MRCHGRNNFGKKLSGWSYASCNVEFPSRHSLLYSSIHLFFVDSFLSLFTASSFLILSLPLNTFHFHSASARRLLRCDLIQLPSYWKADIFLAAREIRRLLLTPKFDHYFHNGPPPVPVLGEINPFHIHALFHYD